MAATPTWLSIRDAVEEILKRHGAGTAQHPAPVQARPGPGRPDEDMGARYGALYAPGPSDMAELRRQ